MARKSMLRGADWLAGARRAGYRVKTVAGNLGHVAFAAEQFFGKEHGESPHAAFARWRLAHIRKLLRGKCNMSSDEIAREVGLANRAALSRFISRESGRTLDELRRRANGKPSQLAYKKIRPNTSAPPSLAAAGHAA